MDYLVNSMLLDFKNIALQLPHLALANLVEPDAVSQEFNASAEAFQKDVDKTRTDLDSIVSMIQNTSDQLDRDVLQSAHDSIDGLQAAVGKVFELAVFIRGDYDNREVDEDQKKLILHGAVEAFESVQKISEAGLRKIGDAQARVTDIEQVHTKPLQGRANVLAQQNATFLASIQGSIADAQNNTQVFQKSVADETNAISTLQDKITSTIIATTTSDVVFTVLTLGIGNVINRGPLDPFGLHQQLEDACRARNDAVLKLATANNHLAQLNNTLALLQIRLGIQKQIQNILPALQARASETMSKILMLEQQFAPFKDTSTKLLLQIRQVENSAVVASAIDYTKQEFALSVLNVAEGALVDGHLIDLARQIKGDIFDNYGAPLPQEILESGKQIDEKTMTLSNIASVKTISL